MSGTNLNPMVMRSPGKINLFLHVTGTRNDGYHLLETVFQFLDFADTLKFEITENPRIVRKDDHGFDIPDTDLTIRAAKLLQEKYQTGKGPGVRITLIKNIPPGSGMGGGSSNAAITLLALNKLWKIGLTRRELLPLAAQLGADVPVFVYGKACWATGIGDKFELFTPQQSWYCICLPSVEVSNTVEG